VHNILGIGHSKSTHNIQNNISNLYEGSPAIIKTNVILQTTFSVRLDHLDGFAFASQLLFERTGLAWLSTFEIMINCRDLVR
jgi:hypothetical protein